jgi:hypothetical protein
MICGYLFLLYILFCQERRKSLESQMHKVALLENREAELRDTVSDKNREIQQLTDRIAVRIILFMQLTPHFDKIIFQFMSCTECWYILISKSCMCIYAWPFHKIFICNWGDPMTIMFKFSFCWLFNNLTNVFINYFIQCTVIEYNKWCMSYLIFFYFTGTGRHVGK